VANQLENPAKLAKASESETQQPLARWLMACEMASARQRRRRRLRRQPRLAKPALALAITLAASSASSASAWLSASESVKLA